MLKVPKSPELLLPKPKRRNKRKTFWRNGHEYLYGQQAHYDRRREIYIRAKGQCQGCEISHMVYWDDGEWHHNVKTYGGRRCDCAACGLWVCKAWHQAHHNRVVKWSKP